MRANNLASEAQAEAHAFHVVTAGWVGAVEPLENAVTISGRNAGAGLFEGDELCEFTTPPACRIATAMSVPFHGSLSPFPAFVNF